MSQNDIDKMNSIIRGTEPILSRWEKGVEFLSSNKLVTKLLLSPSLILCHPNNRSKLGLNAFEVHRVGQKVVVIGFSREELRGAVCIEMMPDSEKNMAQLKFNEELVSKSDEMLAPIGGGEKYLSLGGGHMCAFIRAVMAGCKTSEPTLADPSDPTSTRLHTTKLCKDHVLNEISTAGYEWLVVSWKVETCCPEFYDFAQRALNSCNSIASECSELEVMASISEFAALQARSGVDVDWEQCISAACSGSPRSAPYAATLAAFVRNFGGGPSAPVVHDLDAFAKQHAQNLILGAEFLEAVVAMKMPDVSPCPRFRSACLATNLTSNKSSDGVSKLLVKADIGKFQTKETMKKVLALETQFESSEKLIKDLVDGGHLPLNTGRDVMFLFMIRSVAHLANKGLLTYMRKAYDLQEEILDIFYEEVNKNIPADRKVKGSTESKPTSSDSAAKKANDIAHVATPSFDDLKDPTIIAKSHGFEVGKFVFEKKMGPKSLYEVIELGEDVSMRLHNLIPVEKVQTGKVKLQAFLKEWALFKGDVPTLVSQGHVSKHQLCAQSSLVLYDAARSGLFDALMSYSQKGSDKTLDMIYFSTFPTAVFAKERIASEKLEIVPLVPMSQIVVAVNSAMGIDTHNVVTVSKIKQRIYINRLPLINAKDLGSDSATGYVHPYFWMMASKTDNKEACKR